jgi:CheY-like chemotaxis protein/anti-sigma regulatory factor (Ser/Thr protein kinase)
MPAEVDGRLLPSREARYNFCRADPVFRTDTRTGDVAAAPCGASVRLPRGEAPVADSDVLIVDDDDATREGLRALLGGAGFACETANDGAEAVEKIDRHDFGVVLLDMRLPRVGGLDVLAHCTAKPRPAKIIVMTGVDVTDAALGALRGQAYDFLPKPIEPPRLVAMVRRALATARGVPGIEVLSARPEWVELLVPCTREAADRIGNFIQHLEADLPADVRESVGVAFRELLLNGIEWGGHLDPDLKVRVACLRTRRMLLYRIADPGPGFRFDALPHAAAGRLSDAIGHDAVREQQGIRPGGFGLVMIRAIADELIYNERQNEVVFVKYLDEPPEPAPVPGQA